MRIKKIELNKIKSFDSSVSVELNEDTSQFAFSGKNGAGKSTILKSAWLVQKAYFCSLIDDPIEKENLNREASRFLNGADSYIKITIVEGGEQSTISLSAGPQAPVLNVEDDQLLYKSWTLKNPQNLILFIDAGKGFSEDTLSFDEIDIGKNTKNDLAIEAIFRPESLFSGIYRQLIRDYVHDRLVPIKPDRLIYYKVASKMFTKLIPGVELKNFSGNHNPGEFVLLGKANSDRRKPLYDVREFSSGEKALLSTLAFLCISKSVSALIIDEPENHFHESLLLEFISILSALCEQGGVLNWAESENSSRRIKEDWLKKEYSEHNLNQILVSTHNKALIYKVFSIGENFIVDENIEGIEYEDAEGELRKLGLSSVYAKVLLVEGDGDHEALENAFKGEPVKVVPLGGGEAVIDTFKKLSKLKDYVQESKFVFLVDSDNRGAEFFSAIEEIDPVFYGESFVTLEMHEFENYLLDSSAFRAVIEQYMNVSGTEVPDDLETQIGAKLAEIAKESLPRVLKKEMSLRFRHNTQRYFSDAIWGNKEFSWDSESSVLSELEHRAFNDDDVGDLHEIMKASAKEIFSFYEDAEDSVLLAKCDGKQVLGKAIGHFSSMAGVDGKSFRKAIYRHSFGNKASRAQNLIEDLRSRFD